MNLEWIEIKITSRSDALEMLTGYLMSKNVPNVRIIDDVGVDRFLLDHPLNWDYKDESVKTSSDEAEVIFYLPDDDVGRSRLSDIEQGLGELLLIPGLDFGKLRLSHGPVNDDDWLHEWKKTYKPFVIGKNVLVRPVWEEAVPEHGQTIFTIDPGAVFGTGLHATTQLCVMALEDVPVLKGKNVFDIGCGSGILSVIALLLGAERALAVDIDPAAARCAKENAQLNGIDSSRYEAITGNIFEEDFSDTFASTITGKFDIVLANIVADVIIGLVDIVPRYLNDDGLFIMSGIIDDRINDVHEALAKKFDIVNEREMDGWYSITGKMTDFSKNLNNHKANSDV